MLLSLAPTLDTSLANGGVPIDIACSTGRS
jgi:hypothetical protein